MIEFEHVHKRFGEHVVIDDLSLRIEDGEFFVLVGPSGSGKSTLLRTVNRLVPVDTGTVRINGEDVATREIETLRRGIGYAIQSVGLFPHRTVAENIATVPRLLRWPDAEVRARVDELIVLLRLDEPGIADRYPHTLSGGQQQRVGVARALAARPRIVLMDEPFGALDPLTRESLQGSLKSIQRDTGTTILFVTHDMDEAFGLGDRVGLMLDGRLAQVGTPLDFLRHPADDRVREFVGGTRARLRELAVRTVGESMRVGDHAEGGAVEATASLQEALGAMLTQGRDRLPVCHRGELVGTIVLGDLVVRSPAVDGGTTRGRGPG